MPCHVVHVVAVMLLPLSLSARRRVTSNLGHVTSFLPCDRDFCPVTSNFGVP